MLWVLHSAYSTATTRQRATIPSGPHHAAAVSLLSSKRLCNNSGAGKPRNFTLASITAVVATRLAGVDNFLPSPHPPTTHLSPLDERRPPEIDACCRYVSYDSRTSQTGVALKHTSHHQFDSECQSITIRPLPYSSSGHFRHLAIRRPAILRVEYTLKFRRFCFLSPQSIDVIRCD